MPMKAISDENGRMVAAPNALRNSIE